MSTDPTREAACMAVVQLRADNGWNEVTDGQVVDAVLAVVYSQDWLTQIVQAVHGYSCGGIYDGHSPRCSLVPLSLRAAAGLERPS